MTLTACLWSCVAMAAVSQSFKKEYNEAYLAMIGAAGCVESYLEHGGENNFSFLKTCGWTAEYYDIGEKKLKVHLFLAHKDTDGGQRVYFLIFRGTSELNDWGFNLKAGHCGYAGQNLMQMEQAATGTYDKTRPAVHKGFNLYVEKVLKNFILEEDGRNFRGVFAQIRDNPRCRLVVAGHSLGGAAAALLGQRLYDLGMPPERFQVLTFGAPAVGNAAFAEELGNRIVLWRFTTTADPVPVSVQTFFRDYRHFGNHVKFDVDVRFTDYQHNCTLYLDNAFLRYYGIRRKLEEKLGESLRPKERLLDGVAPVGVQVTLSREASRYQYMPELREFLMDQYAGCLPSYRMQDGNVNFTDCPYRIYCEINGRQDRKDKAWHVEVIQNIYGPNKQLLGMAIHSKRVVSGSGNVKSLAENWLEAREDLRKQIPGIRDGAKLNLLTE